MTERIRATFKLSTAIILAETFHNNQMDRSGVPYINHLKAVMNQLQGEESQMAGILHDIVEDTEMTLTELTRMGCPESVTVALKIVSHPPLFNEEQYLEMVKEIADSKNQIAIDVKWADLTHNSDMSRVENPNDYELKRQAKYLKAKEILKPFISEYLFVESSDKL